MLGSVPATHRSLHTRTRENHGTTREPDHEEAVAGELLLEDGRGGGLPRTRPPGRSPSARPSQSEEKAGRGVGLSP